MKTKLCRQSQKINAGLMLSWFLVFSFPALSKNFSAQQKTSEESFSYFQDAEIVLDEANVIQKTNDIGSVGKFKYSLDSSISALPTQTTATSTDWKLVKNQSTGEFGLTKGWLILLHEAGIDPQAMVQDLSLNVVKQLAELNRIVVRVPDLADLNNFRNALEKDSRILSTELDVIYRMPELQ